MNSDYLCGSLSVFFKFDSHSVAVRERYNEHQREQISLSILNSYTKLNQGKNN